jgi:ubiquinone/menaquinone biosynthesis C-methylase UbiE
MMNNVQSFSQSSDRYAKHRPQYPAELFEYLSGISPGHESAWDCATGNGQAAVSLAEYFARVEATDISAEQIEHGMAHPRVQYSVSPAEQTPFEDDSFDLITVATAVHWFDPEKFHREVERVLKPGGVLAVWTYSYFEIEPAIDKVIRDGLLHPIHPYWAEGNLQVLNGYRDLRLPLIEFSTPKFTMKVEWKLTQLLAYMQTWSAVKRYIADRGIDPIEVLEKHLGPVWEEAGAIREVKMPLYLRACRKPSSI